MQDQVMPDGSWEFDADVTEVFDDMLARSIPQYKVMRQACFEIGSRYAKRATDIVDLGCSRGEVLAPLVDKFGVDNRYIGVEISDPMLEAARARFEGYINCGIVDIRKMDLRYEYPPVLASLALSVLTLQFTPIEYRLQILSRIYEGLIEGGALILVEKVLGASASLDEMMVALYYNMKRQNGYTEDQIQRKRMSLEGVLVPMTARWNEEMLQITGFRQIDCFWRWLNFAGWVAVK